MSECKHSFYPVKYSSAGCKRPYRFIRTCRLCGYTEELGNSGEIEEHSFIKKELIREDLNLRIIKETCEKCGKSEYKTERINNKSKKIKVSKKKQRRVILISIISLFLFNICVFINFIKIPNKENTVLTSELSPSSVYTISESKETLFHTVFEKTSAAIYTDAEITMPETVMSEPTIVETTTTEPTAVENTTAITMTSIENVTATAITETIAETTIYTTAVETTINVTIESILESILESTAESTVDEIVVPENGQIYLGEEIYDFITMNLSMVVIVDPLNTYSFPQNIKIEEDLWPPSDSFICEYVYTDRLYYYFTRF